MGKLEVNNAGNKKFIQFSLKDVSFSLTITLLGKQLTLYSTSYFPCLFVVCQEMRPDVLQSLINEPWNIFKEILISDAKHWPNIKTQVLLNLLQECFKNGSSI